MVLNVSKTKVMLFGENGDDRFELCMPSNKVEQVSKIKYLGVWLDHQLDYSLQVDYAISKAKRSVAKVCSLFDSREGIKSIVHPDDGDDNDFEYCDSKAVGKRVTSLKCELEGIVYDLEHSIDYLKVSKHNSVGMKLYIMCDCFEAIVICLKRLSAVSRVELFKGLVYVEVALPEMKVDVIIAWIPGH